MTKKLLDLTTREFAAVLLRYSPKQSITIQSPSLPGKKIVQEFSGNYDQIIEALSGDPGMQEVFVDWLFDYRLFLDETDTIKYMQYRTDRFDPDLTRAFIKDLELQASSLLDEAKDIYRDPEQYDSWKKKNAVMLNDALAFLYDKCKPADRDGSIVREQTSSSEDAINEVNGVILSTRMEHYLSKAAPLFIDGRWHNNDRLEYAVFLKVLYLKVYRLDWETTKRVMWNKVILNPLADGTLLDSRQFTEAMKRYSDNSDGIRTRFEKMLGDI